MNDTQKKILYYEAMKKIEAIALSMEALIEYTNEIIDCNTPREKIYGKLDYKSYVFHLLIPDDLPIAKKTIRGNFNNEHKRT